MHTVISIDDDVPANFKVVCIKIPACSHDKQAFKCRLIKELSTECTDGACKDAIWKITCEGLPIRYVHLFGGMQSLRAMLKKFSFFDGEKCIFNYDTSSIRHKNISLHLLRHNVKMPHFKVRDSRRPMALLKPVEKIYSKNIPCHTSTIDTGIPQISDSSGICWWGAMWFALCYSDISKSIIEKYASESNVKFKGEFIHLLRGILSQDGNSERMRQLLYDELSLGDDPHQDPYLDGQNAYAQFSIMCSAFGIPLTTYIVPHLNEEVRIKMKNSREEDVELPPQMEKYGCYMGIRTYRSQYKPARVMQKNGKTWKLFAAMIGSEYCGHQIAISSKCGDMNGWAYYDSDAVKDKIGPISWTVPASSSDAEWWKLMDEITPIVNGAATTKYCDMNPHNRHPLTVLLDSLEAEGNDVEVLNKYKNTREDDNLVNMDWLYVSI